MSLKKRNSNSSKFRKNDSFQAKMDLSMSGNEATLRRKTSIDKKVFKEQLWACGKVIGKIKGHFQFLNLPIMQQMSLGILTENGIMMNAAPIIIEEKEGNFMNFMKKNQRNDKITKLIDLTKKLKKIDGLKNKKQIYKTYNEKENILNDMIIILSDSDKAVKGHIFKYQDDLDLIRAQSAMIELAFHCLLMADNVRYEFKRDYYEILTQIFMRDELKLDNLALSSEQTKLEEREE